jgi:membrane protease subunit (stomatin/prohibitin family)
MGLIKAASGAFTGQLADQWREYFYAESLSVDTLAVKGRKRVDAYRSSNAEGSDNLISNGSILAVADGQCAIIVEQGKVVEVCVEPGEFIWDSSTEPTLLHGSLGKSIETSLKTLGRRFTFGGDTAKDQRIYYFNVKEIVDNKFGTASPIPFRMVDTGIGLDLDLAVRCNGVYSFRIVDPVLFYSSVTGNIEAPYMREQLRPQLNTELLTALQPAFAQISARGLRYSQIPAHASEIADMLDEILSDSWGRLRGIDLVSMGFNSISLPPEDEERIKTVQLTSVMRDTTMAAATLVGAQSEAMKAAGANEGGAMLGFMGLGMAQAAGGNNAAQLYQMGQAEAGAKTVEAEAVGAAGGGAAAAVPEATSAAVPAAAPEAASAAVPAAAPPTTAPSAASHPAATSEAWDCSCGQTGNQGKFCQECGRARPQGPNI